MFENQANHISKKQSLIITKILQIFQEQTRKHQHNVNEKLAELTKVHSQRIYTPSKNNM